MGSRDIGKMVEFCGVVDIQRPITLPVIMLQAYFNYHYEGF